MLLTTALIRMICKYYPRGSRELLGAFHLNLGIQLSGSKREKIKAESDGRMFHSASQTIIDSPAD